LVALPALSVVAAAPLQALQGLLVVSVLAVSGAVNYFPVNFMAAGLGVACFWQMLYGLLAFYGRFQRIMRREKSRQIDDDGLGLLGLTFTSLIASIIGALP